jgi:hypothetical protein
MKFAWDTQLVDLFGRPITNEAGTPALLGDLVVSSLMVADRKDLDGAEKFARFRLAAKVSANEDIDVTEAALIKEVVGNVLTPLPVGRIWELLEKPLA